VTRCRASVSTRKCSDAYSAPKMRRRLHPPPRTAPDVMSQDELRHYIREFLYNPAFGWSESKLALARYLGIDLPGLRSKIRQGRTQARFVGGEQIRFTRQIRRLLAGEVVAKQMRAPSGHMRWDAVIADPPQPIHLPARLRWDLAKGRIERVPPAAPCYGPTLPSFRDIFERAEPWAPRSMRPTPSRG
jgi:hypothetical protein